MSANRRMVHFEGTFRGIYRIGTSRAHLGTGDFREMEWELLEINITRQLKDRSVETEKVLDYQYLPVLFSSHRHGMFRWPLADITIVNQEYRKYSPDLRDVILTGHTGARLSDGTALRESVSKPISADHRECTGTIRFSLTAPAEEEKKPVKTEQPVREDLQNVTLTTDVGDDLLVGQDRPKTAAFYPDEVTATTTTEDPVQIQRPVRPAPVQTIKPLGQRLTGCLGTLLMLGFAIWIATKIPILGIIALAILVAYLLRGKGSGRPSSGFSPWSFVMLLLAGGLLYRLWSEDQKMFHILLLLTLVYLFSRGSRSTFIRNAIGLLMFLFVAGIGLSMSDWKKYLPALPEDEESSVRLREVRADSLGNRPDSLFIHEADWHDFESNHFEGEYTTSLLQVMQSAKFHRTLADMETPTQVNKYWQSIYQLMAQNDSRKLDSLVEFFRIRSKALDMTPAQTAEMVVTFIQNIPYVLIHEGTCEEALQSGNEFMVEYHQQGKACVAEVVAGVQSPYEFVHDLKGDCDTRSLLGFTILRAMKIPCSVWISQAYGHSILGVGLPAGGSNYKSVNGVRHFGVELTATGFRLGMIAPDQTDMDNWGVVVFNNF